MADGVTLDEPLTSEAEVVAAKAAGDLSITKGRPDIQRASPNSFIYPLSGKA